MTIYKVRKRNGAIETFDSKRISIAIERAIKSVGGSDFKEVSQITTHVITVLEKKSGVHIPSVEQIQDAVEESLIKF